MTGNTCQGKGPKDSNDTSALPCDPEAPPPHPTPFAGVGERVYFLSWPAEGLPRAWSVRQADTNQSTGILNGSSTQEACLACFTPVGPGYGLGQGGLASPKRDRGG